MIYYYDLLLIFYNLIDFWSKVIQKLKKLFYTEYMII